MTRAREGKMVAGVCAGLARATGTDPVLFRIILTVLAFFGGIGALLYVLAWLLLPVEDEPASPLESLLGRGQSGTAPALTIGLIALAALLLAGALSNSFRNSFLLVVCLAAGVLLLRRTGGIGGPGGGPGTGGPGTGGPGTGGPGGGPGGGFGGPYPGPTPYGGPQADTGPTMPTDPAAAPHVGQDGFASAGPVAPEAPVDPADPTAPVGATAPIDAGPAIDAGPPINAGPPLDAGAPEAPPAAPQAPAWTYPAASGATTSGSWATATAAPPPYTPPPYTPPFAPYGPYGSFDPGRPTSAVRPTPPPASRKRRPKERSVLGRLTFSLACLALVVLSIIDAAGVSVPFTGYVALALLIVTLGLFVGVWLGRARKLIPLGIILTLALAAGSGVKHVDGADGLHDVVAAPTTVAAVQPSYNVGVGDLTLDLSAVKFASDQNIDIEGGLGDVRVTVPSDVNVDVVWDVGLGDADIFDQHESGPGVHNETHHTGTGGSTASTLKLEIHQGVGDVRVGVS